MKPILKYPPKADVILLRPEILPGHVVQLEPLNLNHVEELTIAAEETEWKYLFDASLYYKWGAPGLVQELIRRQEEDETDIPFAVIHRPLKVAIGITRFLHIDKGNKKLEIATWYAKDFHRTGVNREAKWLLLQRAFDVWGFNRVEFNIDERNEKSVEAIKRIGATCEAKKLRKNIILQDGTERTSVLYSIIREQWTAKVKPLLEQLLDAHPDPEEEQRAKDDVSALLERQANNHRKALTRIEKKLERARSTNGEGAARIPENR